MAVPTWIPGQVLTASDVNTWFVPIIAYKTAGTTRNTLSPALDPDLGINLPVASAYYEVTGGIGYNCASGGISWNFVLPFGGTGNYSVAAQMGGPAAVSSSWGGIVTGSSSTVGGLLIKGIFATGGTGASLGFSWASNSGPSSLTVNTSSYLKAVRVG
jgi:hypothetical protein